MRLRPVAVLGAALLACTGVLGACTTPEVVTGPQVGVNGEPGVQPELVFTSPLEVTEPSVEVIAEGDGPRLVEGQAVLVDFYAESGADHAVLGETYSSEPKAYLLGPASLGTALYDGLRDQRVGSRVLALVPGSEQEPATVAVFDILPTRATGEPVEPREGLPTVELGSDGAPTITVPALEPPVEAVVQPLIRGEGPQVAAGQVITVRYTGVTWSDGSVVDTSWGDAALPTSFPIGVGSVLPGWDAGLVEQRVGSQVLLVVPPSLGYGGDNPLAQETLVFVVDILAARGGPEVG